MAGEEKKAARAFSKEVYEWTARQIVQEEMNKGTGRPAFDANISLARAMFKEFGGSAYDDNKFLHFLKDLYEAALDAEK